MIKSDFSQISFTITNKMYYSYTTLSQDENYCKRLEINTEI
jgi:hypothetical protein